ncbi:MAG: hypothetical protein COA57_07865 [Flavobacteriales bacterium]|nr:MAG: hypothetical protein COA57_07865 [Flavobacteriales bacterium]
MKTKKIVLLILLMTMFPAIQAMAEKPNDTKPIENFYVVANTEIVMLSWTMKNELDDFNYVIERSTDGKVFKVIKSKKGIASHYDMMYFFNDVPPAVGHYYYRIKKTGRSVLYSDVKKVAVKNADQSLFSNSAY